MTDTRLETRSRLPDALRVLLGAHPRSGWTAHPQFKGLVSFWLERHLMFRQLMERMRHDTEAFLGGTQSPAHFAQAVARNGGVFVDQLHGHHQIEDHHYFPLLRKKEPRIATGFDLLDADHHALDALLDGFVQQANDAIRSAQGADALAKAGELHTGLLDLERRIGRHLADEEDLIVPVILTHGASGLE